MDILQEIDFFKAQFAAVSDPKRAESEKKYLRSTMKFYGTGMPKLREISKAWYKAHKNEPLAEVFQLAETLWNSDWHEEKVMGLSLLIQRGKEMTFDHISLIDRMVNRFDTWAHGDELAIHLVGRMIDNDPRTLDILTQWAKSANFWVRRTAILAQILQFRRGEGHFTLYEQVVVPNFNEGKDWSKDEKFFIRKAIGWSLRELAPKKPEVVYNFVTQYQQQMSSLTYREATRKLPKGT